jgi:hypothetical protein
VFKIKKSTNVPGERLVQRARIKGCKWGSQLRLLPLGVGRVGQVIRRNLSYAIACMGLQPKALHGWKQSVTDATHITILQTKRWRGEENLWI